MNLIVLCLLFVFNDDYLAWIWVHFLHKGGLFIQPRGASLLLHLDPNPILISIASWLDGVCVCVCVTSEHTSCFARGALEGRWGSAGSWRLGAGGWSAAVVIT